MNKLLGDKISKAKKDIKTRYLAGEPVTHIAMSYGVSDRNVYYHLGELTPNDKALHIKNYSLRRIADKQHRKEDHGKTNENSESTTETTESSLADFIK
jgi:hypothetical protein